ncbi:MAG: fimbrillin family protein [Bacteroidaceae bacterium]|nr:fimbrillin family protein [Bacteroidaceae bacterium]
MKKRLLLIAVAGAIVVGCADEMLDTSYESVLKEAQLKGDHPLVFNAYVGNGMANTRAYALQGSGSNGIVLSPTDMDGNDISNIGNYLYQQAAGVFAYYTGSRTITTGSSGNNLFSGSGSNYMTSSLERVDIGQPNFLDNMSLYYRNSEWKTAVKTRSSGSTDEVTLYWPTKRLDSSTSEYVTFFAYYPYVYRESGSYNDPKLANLHIIAEGQTGAPMLDYQVAYGSSGENSFRNLDLMAAEPVLNRAIATSSPNPVDLRFKHLLAAVSVKVKYEVSNNSNYSTSGYSESPEIFFYKTEMQGANEYGSIELDTQFTKRGLFNLATGRWYTNGFETLNLLGDTWLTKTSTVKFSNGNRYSLFYPTSSNTQPSGSSSQDFSVTNPSDFKNSPDDDNYMLIIPNYNQKKLKVNLGYSIKNGSSFENVDISKDIDLKIEPGKIYQILLTIKKDVLNFDVHVDPWNHNPSTGENI